MAFFRNHLREAVGIDFAVVSLGASKKAASRHDSRSRRLDRDHRPHAEKDRRRLRFSNLQSALSKCRRDDKGKSGHRTATIPA